MRSHLVQDLLRPESLAGVTFPSSCGSIDSPSAHRHSVWYVVIVALFCVFGSSLAHASTYYLAPYGSDSNSGTSASSPWVSPNHSLNCGDTIVAAASTNYSATNFYTGKWGTVNCPAGNSVAWLTCEKFDACKIDTTANAGMWVDRATGGSRAGK
jgi:hypothetical protein